MSVALAPLPVDAPARTIPELVRWAGAAGGRPVLTATSAAGTERVVTGEELPDLVARCARLLESWRLEPGQRVGVHLDNTAALEALIIQLGAQWLGAVPVPLGTRLSAREVRDLLAHASAQLVVSGGGTMPLARRAASGLAEVVDVGAGLDELLRGRVARVPEPVAEDDLADILYTSGTAGRPKGVELTHGNCIACGMELREAVGLREDDVYQSAVPYFTSTGAHTNPLMALVARAHHLVERSFDQHAAVQRFERHGTTVYFGVPSMLTLIARDADLTRLPPALRTIVFGGSATTASAIARLDAAFGGRALVNLYGQTEAGPGGTVLGPEDTLRKAGSVGRRGNGPQTEFRVVREDDTDADVDEVGEIVLRSPAVMRGYHRDPEATAVALRGGWLHTTDLGRVDADGYLWFVDRRSDLVVRGGFNVSTSEVEAVLQAHDLVVEAAVVGRPHDVLGEDLSAYVVAEPAAAREELDAYLRANLADYKVPRQLELVPELPRGPMGKVLKRELRTRKEP